jgi:glycosyltransferase 2 family protein
MNDAGAGNRLTGRVANRVAHMAGIVIGLAGLGFVAVRVGRDRDDIGDAMAAADPIWMIAAAISGLAAMTLLGVNWLVIVRAGGAAAPLRRGLAWFFVGQLGKYVPGGIWPIVGQAELAHRDRTPRSIAYWSTALSMVATLLGAAVVAAIAGLVAPAGSRLVPAVVAAGCLVTLGALAVRPLRSRLHRAVDRLTPRELRLPPAGWFTGIVARYLPVWVLFAGMTVGCVAALGADLHTELVVTVIYAACLSWIAGFVIVGLPGGLGVREAVLISLLSAPLGSGVAVSAALLSRVVSIGVDLIGAAVAAPVARFAPPLDHDDAETPARYAAP